jgi:hypothetical protein
MKRPPKDGKEYMYDEKRRKWIEIKEKDVYGFPLTTERFEALRPFPSWIFSEDVGWIPPVPMPEDGNRYVWEESGQRWVLIPDAPNHDHKCAKCGKEHSAKQLDGGLDTHSALPIEQPWPSWTLQEDGTWAPPIPMPEDGKVYGWDEYTQEWFLISEELFNQMKEEA